MRKTFRTIAIVAALAWLVVSCKQSSTVDPADNPASADTPSGSAPATPAASPAAASHTITFLASGGTGTMAPQIIPEGQSAALTPNAFAKKGYYFAGWSTGVAGSALIADGATYAMGASDVTLTAVWSENPAYAITFDPDGGSGTMAAQSIVSGLTATLAPNAFTRAGYAFTGWATTRGGAVAYADCAIYSMGSASVTLYATWRINPSHAVHFDAGGGVGCMPDVSVVEGQSLALPENSFANPGYHFAGWSTGVAGSAAIADEATYTMGQSDVTLVATWSENPSYSITFDPDGGAGTMPAQSIADGASANLAANGFTRVGHSFAGWATSRGGPAEYADRERYAMGSGPVTLYATWVLKPSHALRFDASGGTGSMSNLSIVEELSATIPANSFEKPGCRFAGWATSPGGPFAFAAGATYVMGSADATLYAVWERWTALVEAESVGLGVDCDQNGYAYLVGNNNSNTSGVYLNTFVKKYNSVGDTVWTVTLNANGKEASGYDIAVDINGNSYICGKANGVVENQQCAGTNDILLAKISPAGAIVWVKLVGSSGTIATAMAIDVDQQGSCCITGYTTGPINGVSPLAGNSTEAFISWYDANGNHIWTKLLGAYSNGYDVVVGPNGSAFICGRTAESVGGKDLTGKTDMFLCKYDQAGNRTWINLAGVPAAQTKALGLAIDGGNSVYVCGTTDGNLGETKTGLSDMFVQKYTVSGAFEWMHLLGTSGSSSSATDACVDSQGALFVSGITDSSLDGQAGSSGKNAFVVKYLSNGSKQRTKLMGKVTTWCWDPSICCDSTDSLTVAGTAMGSFDGKTFPYFRSAFVTTRFNP